jgi:hypothetical protein
VNLTETTQGVYGAFQDVEFDGRGNVYVVGTYPSSILRVEGNGTRVNEWYRGKENQTTSVCTLTFDRPLALYSLPRYTLFSSS